MSVKVFIAPTEARIKWYKEEMSNLHRFKEDYMKCGQESYDWYKEHIREMKTLEEGRLKAIKLEREYENQGLNPPFFYKY